MSKKKNEAKTSKREKFEKSYALKRFDNPVVKSWGKTLNDANPLVFTSLIRDLFGKKTGQKILDKINTYSKANEALISICKECESRKPVEDIPENKISWKMVDPYRGCSWEYLDELHSKMFKKLEDVLSMAIVNETIKNINVQLEFRSPYYSDSKVFYVPESILHEVSTASELNEVIYSLVYEMLTHFTRDAMNYIEKEMCDLSDIIKDDYNCLNDMTFSGSMSNEVRELMYDITTDIALILASSMGIASHDYGYTPEFHPRYLLPITASDAIIGVHIVSVAFINERDKDDVQEYRTVYPPKKTISKELYNSMVASASYEEAYEETLETEEPAEAEVESDITVATETEETAETESD